MPHTILAIDDNKNILKIIETFLSREGYTVITRENADDGFAVLRDTPVDLILMDVMMPKKSGYQAVNELQTNPQTRAIPVILITAKAVIQYSSKDFLWKIYGYLTKPFSQAELLEKVKTVLEASARMHRATPGQGDTQ